MDITTTDIILLLEPIAKNGICGALQRFKDERPDLWAIWQAECDRLDVANAGLQGHTFQFKYFAVNVCTGDVFYTPLPKVGSPRRSAYDEHGQKMSLEYDLSCII